MPHSVTFDRLHFSYARMNKLRYLMFIAWHSLLRHQSVWKQNHGEHHLSMKYIFCFFVLQLALVDRKAQSTFDISVIMLSRASERKITFSFFLLFIPCQSPTDSITPRLQSYPFYSAWEILLYCSQDLIFLPIMSFSFLVRGVHLFFFFISSPQYFASFWLI